MDRNGKRWALVVPIFCLVCMNSYPLAAAKSVSHRAVKFTSEEMSLIRSERAESNYCTTHGDDQDTIETAQAEQRACDISDQLEDAIAKHGICWGPKSARQSKKHWLRCRPAKVANDRFRISGE
jgi:hypothetical protein